MIPQTLGWAEKGVLVSSIPFVYKLYFYNWWGIPPSHNVNKGPFFNGSNDVLELFFRDKEFIILVRRLPVGVLPKQGYIKSRM